MFRLDKVIKPWKESAALNDNTPFFGFVDKRPRGRTAQACDLFHVPEVERGFASLVEFDEEGGGLWTQRLCGMIIHVRSVPLRGTYQA
jgi:hypothetical protein